MLAILNDGVNWVHQDPVTKSQRITNSAGTVTSTIDLDPWGGETARSSNAAFQPHKYTTYERDANGGDEAMMRRYQSNWTRFSQPDPYDGSYDGTDPQSFNRYSYVQNDPVNFVDPSGLNMAGHGFCYLVPVGTDRTGEIVVYEQRCVFWGSGGGPISGGRGPGVEPGGGGGGRQEPAKPSHDRDGRTDCQRFVAAVGVIANNSTSNRGFLDELARQFTSANDSSGKEMFENSDSMVLPPRLGANMLDSGFKLEFRDPGSNQVRHFVGGLIAGYNFNSSIQARAFMNAQEGSLRSTADTRLNNVSTGMGAGLYGNQPGLLPKPNRFNWKNVADAIRRLVCE